MEYCTYLTIYFGDLLPRRYIGSTAVHKIKNGYNGTIRSKKYQKIYLKEQRENKHLFKSRILSLHTTRKEALDFELMLQIKFDVVKSPKYMNMSLAKPNGFFGRDVKGESHPLFRKSHSSNTKNKISTSLKEKYQNGLIVSPFRTLRFFGEENHFYNKKHSEETKNKMRKPKRFVPKWLCSYCDRYFDGGNFDQHMKRKHSWSKDQCITVRSRNLPQ